MQKKYFSTDQVPQRERRDFWQGLVCDYLLDVNANLDSCASRDFRGELVLHDFDCMKMMRVTSPKNLVKRDSARIRRSAEEAFVLLLLQMAGSATLCQDGRSVAMKPGDMTLYDSTMPHFLDVGENCTSLVLRARRDFVVKRIPALPFITAQPLSSNTGMGRVAVEVIGSVAREADHLAAPAAQTLSDAIWDTLALTANALVPGTQSDVPVSVNKLALLQRIKGYINTYLAEPFLTPAHIAAQHHISVRYLNKLFAQEGTSVTRWIRSQRLKRCARDIIASNYNGRSINEIAFSWGFNNMSYFSREFKAVYGCTAREYRRAHRPDY